MSTGNIVSLLASLIFFASAAFAAEPAGESVQLRFNYSDGEWRDLHDEFFQQPGIDLDADQNQEGKLMAVQVDLNGDNIPEYFLRTLCGNGGCDYPIFDGKTYAYLGAVFGSEVWLLEQHSFSLPVIETYSHAGAGIGTLSRYEFIDKKYKAVSTEQIGDDQTQQLYKRLDAAQRIKRGK